MAWAGSGLLFTMALEALPDPLCLIRLQLTSSTSPRPQSSLRCQEATPPWKCPSHSTHTQPLLQLWPFFYQPCPHPPSHNAPLSSRLAKAPACFKIQRNIKKQTNSLVSGVHSSPGDWLSCLPLNPKGLRKPNAQ